MAVSTSQRFTKARPCPICDGYDEAPRGQGIRCFGFFSDDGRYGHCTREEHAGTLEQHPDSGTYAHKLAGDCHCGVQHGPLGPGGNSTRQIVATYPYTDEKGALLSEVVRYLPKGFQQRRPDGVGGSIWNKKGVRRVLYNLPKVIGAEVVFLCEGEKDCHTIARWDWVATTCPEGAKKWREEFSHYLRDKRVAILVDADEDGRKHARQVARSILGVAASIRVLELPGAKDVTEWVEKGGTKEEFRGLIKQAPELDAAGLALLERKWFPVSQGTEKNGPKAPSSQKNKSSTQRDDLVAVGMSAELWHDLDGEAYATIKTDGHKENQRIRHKTFRKWLLRQYGRLNPINLTGGGTRPGAAGSQPLSEALNALEALAMDGLELEPRVRISGAGDKVYVDLGQPNWEAVEISSSGWQIITDPPVKFIRPNGFRQLPTPRFDGDVGRLRRFVNVRNSGDFILVLAWLVRALCPVGPYPVLVVNGEQGSAKTTLCRLLRRLTDPNLAEVRPAPRDERDLFIACRNSHVVAIDNLSSLKAELADAMCRVATGIGFATRTLYTDVDETIICACKPQIVNGIPNLTTRSDLLDRAIVLTLPALRDDERQTEEKFWKEFEEESPLILGKLFDAVACALRRRPEVRLQRPPRMADFAVWVEAAAPSLGLESGEFLSAYERNRGAAISDALEANLVAQAVMDFTEKVGHWEGTATELLNVLSKDLPEHTRHGKMWPKTATHLSNRLRLAAPNLRRFGVSVEFDRITSRRTICLDWVGQTPSSPSPVSRNANNSLKTSAIEGDAGVTLADGSSELTVTSRSLKTRDGDAGDAGDAESDHISKCVIEV